jgi:xylulokinase
VLEGVAFGLRDGFDLMIASGMRAPDSVRASGGGVRSSLWTQILADVLGTTIDKVVTEEGAAYGAAILAAVGAGHFADVETATEKLVTVIGGVGPSQDVDSYAAARVGYQELYPALRPTFHRVASEASQS